MCGTPGFQLYLINDKTLMKKKIVSASTNEGIPVSVSMGPALETEKMQKRQSIDLKRLLYICALAIMNAILVGVIAKVMVSLIGLVTSISFYGNISPNDVSPVGNHLGIWVIFIPVLGGIIVGIMARYGSRAIRGHGIPEAMEQVLTNHSKIPPIVTFLKPLSAAISIGTGGPFGAEGPIIAAGGAFGSLIGQVLKITAYERKILLTAGATAGMAAIFGSPVAAVLLAIELLLFEFSPKSIIPVALACITGAAAHFIFFGSKPMFAMPEVQAPGTLALIIYIFVGALVGVASVGVTKIVYGIEDAFEKLPIHWMWWPAIGGLVVGVVGYFAPVTMGVGYDNIRNVLTGNLTINTLIIFSLLKFISWSISLGSGTSGGTLAPLFTIGGALGALLAMGVNYMFPSLGLSFSIAALIGMAAMFSGASRALLTSVVFALETTGQPHMLLPLLGGCTASYFVSFALMRSTIMTEKIARRGIATPDSYVPDVMNSFSVGHVLREEIIVLSGVNTIAEARKFISEGGDKGYSAFAVVDEIGELMGVIGIQDILNASHDENAILKSLIKSYPSTVHENELLRSAVDKMIKHSVDILPVVSRANDKELLGVLTYRDILEAYELKKKESKEQHRTISVRKQSIRILIKGRQLFKK
jgi:CIC family chloride channel protein